MERITLSLSPTGGEAPHYYKVSGVQIEHYTARGRELRSDSIAAFARAAWNWLLRIARLAKIGSPSNPTLQFPIARG